MKTIKFCRQLLLSFKYFADRFFKKIWRQFFPYRYRITQKKRLTQKPKLEGYETDIEHWWYPMTSTKTFGVDMNVNGKLTKDLSVPLPPKVSGNGKKYIIMSIDFSRTEFRAAINSNPKDILRMPSNVLEMPISEVRCNGFEQSLKSRKDILQEFCFELGDKGFAVGQMAEDEGAKQSKLGNALAKIMAAIIYFELDSDIPLVLTISLPHSSRAKFDERKEQLTEILTHEPHLVKFRGKTYTKNICQLFFIPEGYGSLLYTDANRTEDTPNFKKNSTVIIDIGHETKHFILCRKMKFVAGMSKSTTNLSMSEFCNALSEKIGAPNDESSDLLKAIHLSEGQRIFRPRKKRTLINLDEELPTLKETFAKKICDEALDWLPEEPRYALITGGGGQFYADELFELVEEANLIPWLSEPCRESNVVGGWYYGQTQIEAMQEVEI